MISPEMLTLTKLTKLTNEMVKNGQKPDYVITLKCQCLIRMYHHLTINQRPLHIYA